MVIYIDTGNKCHIDNDGNMVAFETNFFEGKCRAYIEGFRCVPQGESYNGTFAVGDMYFPWADMTVLNAAQAEYEDMLAALELLEVHPDE